jgi:hypothetical protein
MTNESRDFAEWDKFASEVRRKRRKNGLLFVISVVLILVGAVISQW